MYCYLIEDFPVSVMIRLRFLVFLSLHRTTQMYCYLIEDFPVSVMILLRFPAFTQDHTDVLLFNRGFSRFSDDTPTFSCLYTGPHRCTVI